MSTFLGVLLILGVGAVFYAIKRIVYRGIDSIGDSIRNSRIDRNRASGNDGFTENLADRYK